jgi:hypothetical protein
MEDGRGVGIKLPCSSKQPTEPIPRCAQSIARSKESGFPGFLLGASKGTSRCNYDIRYCCVIRAYATFRSLHQYCHWPAVHVHLLTQKRQLLGTVTATALHIYRSSCCQRTLSPHAVRLTSTIPTRQHPTSFHRNLISYPTQAWSRNHIRSCRSSHEAWQ